MRTYVGWISKGTRTSNGKKEVGLGTKTHSGNELKLISTVWQTLKIKTDDLTWSCHNSGSKFGAQLFLIFPCRKKNPSLPPLPLGVFSLSLRYLSFFHHLHPSPLMPTLFHAFSFPLHHLSFSLSPPQCWLCMWTLGYWPILYAVLWQHRKHERKWGNQCVLVCLPLIWQ